MVIPPIAINGHAWYFFIFDGSGEDELVRGLPTLDDKQSLIADKIYSTDKTRLLQLYNDGPYQSNLEYLLLSIASANLLWHPR